MTTPKKGVFYAVGVGPGDPGLITLRAAEVLGRCAVIAAPMTTGGETVALDIARQAVDLSGKTILPLRFTMKRRPEERAGAYEAALALLLPRLDAGEDVAMVNLGDVSLYASVQYLLEALAEKGYSTVMVPGVPSFCAVAARLGISLTGMHTPLHILPGSADLKSALAWPGSKIIMKSGKALPEVLEALAEKGLLENAALVSDCGMPGEAAFPNLAQAAPGEGQAGYFTTVIVKEPT